MNLFPVLFTAAFAAEGKVFMVSYVICNRDSNWYGVGLPGPSRSNFRQVFVMILPDGVKPIRTRCQKTARHFGIEFAWFGQNNMYAPGGFGLYGMEIQAWNWCHDRGAKPSEIYIEDSPEFNLKFHGGKTLAEREAAREAAGVICDTPAEAV